MDNANISISASRESYEEIQCQNILTNYSYDQNLCGASDVESFLREKKEQFTCFNRCNHAVTYGNTRDCACDDLCVVHNDCCRDMRQVCTDVYTRGIKIFSHMIRAVSMCVETSFASITNRRAEFSSSVIPFSTITMATGTTTANTIAENNQKNLMPFKDRDLKGYFHAFGFFKVADLTYGLFFYNYAAFLSWRAPASKPYFIPKLTELDCSGAQDTVLGYSSASNTLPWCRIASIRDIKTFFHRSCRKPKVVGCRCENNQGIWNNLYDSCRGQSNSLGLFNRHSEVAKMLPPYITNTLPTNIGECIFRKVDIDQENQYSNDDVVEISSIKMALTPIFDSVIHESQSAMTDTDNERKRVERYSKEVTIVSDKSERQSLEYLVELTNTIEKRLRCPRFNSFLSDCVLEDCAKGALLSFTPLPDKQFGGRSCILPILAKSQMPVCTCLRLMSALNNLHVWGLKFNHRYHDECSFQLHIRSEGELNQKQKSLLSFTHRAMEIWTTH
ncbi:hypothetical protein PoB_002594500 [Plakobranchus ocellatus]|uniref:SMB domain-containing protein n=1 Tax=Plakobranchus ocellatus TaxID=259542 RepID=A0AAV3ZUE2_9GAST|nr:hypothetical protein PoB_002594500 [Plakobranchus ocellatus]